MGGIQKILIGGETGNSGKVLLFGFGIALGESMWEGEAVRHGVLEEEKKGEFLCVYREKKGERRVRDGIAFLTVILCVTMTNEMYKWRTVIKKEKKRMDGSAVNETFARCNIGVRSLLGEDVWKGSLWLRVYRIFR